MPIVHGRGSGNFFEATGDDGRVRFAHLPSGDFSVEVLGKHARVNQFVEYSPMQDRVGLNVVPEQNKIEIEMPPRRLGQAEIDKRFPFSVVGKVTDTDGNSLANVEVRAATGVGTLMGGGATKTDASGNYRLYFQAGMGRRTSDSAPLGIGVQAAHFYATKEGMRLVADDEYVFFLMTDQAEEQLAAEIENAGQVWSKTDTSEVVFANKPKKLNLVLKKLATK